MAIINRETDYAIRILRAISDGRERSVADICREQQFTQPFAYKIVKKLNQAEFVRVSRGKYGGVSLSCDLKKKSLYDLIEAMDNTFYINDCFKKDYKCEFSCAVPCNAHKGLINLQNNIDKELKAFALSEII